MITNQSVLNLTIANDKKSLYQISGFLLPVLDWVASMALAKLAFKAAGDKKKSWLKDHTFPLFFVHPSLSKNWLH